MKLEKVFINTITKFQLINPEDKILIAFSCGVDSSVLTYLLAKFKSYFDIKELAIAYLNHSIRPEAKYEEEFTIKTAQNLNINYFIKKSDIPKIAKQKKLSIEEAGRIERYTFFNEICKREGFNKIATGHHLTDLVETMFLWFIQGNKNGLRGFKPIHNNIIRPLINITKDQIYKYAKEKNIQYIEDPSNTENKYLRNKVRNQIIPIAKRINPNIESSLFILNTFLNMDEDFFENNIEYNLYNKNHINLEKIKPLHKAFQYRIIDKWVYKNTSVKLSYKQLLEILSILDKDGTKKIQLKPNLFIVKDYTKLYIQNKNEKSIDNINYKIKPGEQVYIKHLNKIVMCTIENSINIDKLRFTKNKECFEIKQFNEGDMFLIRTRKEGDRFKLFNGKEKKLKDVFIDLKIPKEKRNSIPLLTFQDKILWIIGYKRSGYFPISEGSKIICFELKEV